MFVVDKQLSAESYVVVVVVDMCWICKNLATISYVIVTISRLLYHCVEALHWLGLTCFEYRSDVFMQWALTQNGITLNFSVGLSHIKRPNYDYRV